MIELLKLAISKPLHAVVVALCVVVLSTHLGLFQVKEAVAVLQTKNEEHERVNKLVFRMNETLIRIDTNVDSIKEQLKENKDAN